MNLADMLPFYGLLHYCIKEVQCYWASLEQLKCCMQFLSFTHLFSPVIESAVLKMADNC